MDKLLGDLVFVNPPFLGHLAIDLLIESLLADAGLFDALIGDHQSFPAEGCVGGGLLCIALCRRRLALESIATLRASHRVSSWRLLCLSWCPWMCLPVKTIGDFCMRRLIVVIRSKALESTGVSSRSKSIL